MKGLMMKAGGRWRAQIRVNGKSIRRYASSELAAAKAYNALAKQHFGEFARLNCVDGCLVPPGVLCSHGFKTLE